ncbi:MAG: multi-sensor signal transduction histidine kinase [Bacteroidetes bacterium]|nr:multi-sensor signal transduction histidine kinase [Bacteroidota bacterium]
MTDQTRGTYFPFAPSPTGHVDQDHSARLLYSLGGVWAIVATVGMGVMICILPQFWLRAVKYIMMINVSVVICLLLNKQGNFKTGAILFITALWFIVTHMALTAGGITAISVIAYMPVIVMAGLLLGGIWGMLTAGLCMLTTLAMALLDAKGLLPERQIIHTPLSLWIGYSISGVLIAILQYIAWHQSNRAFIRLTEEVNERKKMEERLHESEFNNRMVVENKILGVAWASPDGIVLDASATFCQMLGYSADELRGMHFSDFTHPDDTAIELELIEKIMSGEISNYTIEKRYRHKSGEYLWVELCLTCYRNNETGGIDFFVGLAQNIQTRKTAEYERRQSDAKYRSLMEQASDPIMITDLKGNFSYVNESLCRMFGYSTEELLRMNISVLIDAGQLKTDPIRFDLLAAGITYTRDRKMVHKNGTIIEVEANVKMTPDGNVLAIARNITERKEAQQQLMNERDLSDSVINSLPSLFFILSEEGNFLRWNRNFEEIAGYSRKEILKMNARDFFDEYEKEVVAQKIREILDKGSTEVEVVVTTKRGNKEPHYFTGEAISYKGQRALAVSGMDITERVEARNAINALNESLEKKVAERTAELYDANRELETFNYSVSHDLQAPLRLVNGFAKVLMKEYGDKLDDEGRHSLEIISTNTVRMSQLIRDLLEFSKSGRATLIKEEVDMNGIVLSLIDQAKMGQKDFGTEFILHELETGHSDANLIKQVWANLIFNAVKFSGKKEKPVVEIGNHIKDGEVIYYVRDNGAGFDMQHEAKLFNAFQRLHSQADFEGSGVGLATSHRIVTRHGGRIWVEARLNEGATFYFTLPGNN